MRKQDGDQPQDDDIEAQVEQRAMPDDAIEPNERERTPEHRVDRKCQRRPRKSGEIRTP